jgi:hypothetical protein
LFSCVCRAVSINQPVALQRLRCAWTFTRSALRLRSVPIDVRSVTHEKREPMSLAVLP